MEPKPSHLSAEYGAWFKDPLIAAAYVWRPAYPSSVIQLLADLAVDPPRAVLDIGCGTGDVARLLAPLVERVDAVDFSEPMIASGRRLEGGELPNLRWIVAAVEQARLDPPYALITAGESLHWMDWEVLLPRFREVLTPNGMLAIVDRDFGGPRVLRERLLPLIQRYSPVRDFQPYDVVQELTRRGLFTPLGGQRSGPQPWMPTVDEYLECRHSQRGLSRTHMGPSAASGFDAAVREALADLCQQGAISVQDGRLQLSADFAVRWGEPT